jgi:hypothetical protein
MPRDAARCGLDEPIECFGRWAKTAEASRGREASGDEVADAAPLSIGIGLRRDGIAD